MKVVGLIPFWLNKGKDRDLKKLAGRYLINYSVELLNSSSLIGDVVIYSSDNQVLKYVDHELNVKYKKRPALLDNEDVPTEKIVEEFLSDYEADIVVLLNPSCPFIQVSTINKCIKNIENSKFDSAFSALEFQKYAWSKREPLNFNKDRYSAKLKSLDKINIEQGMMYVLKKDSFLNRTRRIGGNPYIQNINFFEGLEVSSDKDFEVAELIINSGMFHGVGHE